MSARACRCSGGCSPDTALKEDKVVIRTQIFPPGEHDHIWALQEPLNFPLTVFGLERAPDGETIMPEMTTRYARALGRHFEDKQVDF